MESVVRRMREEWDARAVEDARYYTALQRRQQAEEEYERGAGEVVARIRRDYPHLPAREAGERRFLEIGCGLGRLMAPLAADCGEIHGVDISAEMVARARERLAGLEHAHVRVAEKSDLSGFEEASFDLVYSFAVFQHLPDSTLVYQYLDEAHRVLNAGGLFIGQFNGIPRRDARTTTWKGACNREEEVLEYARKKNWAVLASEGADTEYLWVTMKKREASAAEAVSGRATILSVRHPDGGSELVAGGPQGFGEAYVRDLAEGWADLGYLSATVDGERIPVRYLGPTQPENWRQVNVEVPEGIAPGAHQLELRWRRETISNALEVAVRACAPARARLLRITDADEPMLEGKVKCGRMLVSVSGCRTIETLRVTVGGKRVESEEAVCVEPLTRRYRVVVPLPGELEGSQVVQVSVDGEELGPCGVEVSKD